MGKEGKYAILRMPSSEMRRVLLTCRATVGEVGNAEHSNIKIGKAGRNRWKGIRPTVRGTVMNPVDHPHGGGEGKNLSLIHILASENLRYSSLVQKFIVRASLPPIFTVLIAGLGLSP